MSIMSLGPKRYRRTGYVTAIQYEGTVESAIACDLKEEGFTYRRYVDSAHGRLWVTKGDWITTEEARPHLRCVFSSIHFHAQFEEVDK